jgi:spermidine/putrescine transport system substrate-binding protein
MYDKTWFDNLPKYYQRQLLRKGPGKFVVNRRDVLKGAGAAVAGAAAGSLLPGRASAAGTLNYMCWDGYDDPRIVESFEKANDAEVKADLIIDDPGAFAKLAAGGHRDFDVAILDSPWNLRFGPAGLCEFLKYEDYKEEYDRMYPQFAHPFKPLMWEDKICGLPTRFGWVAVPLSLKHSKIEDWRDGYGPCFDPKNRDKIGVMDWGDWPILPMAFYAGINPYEELDQHQLDEIRKVLRALFKNTRALFADLTLAQKALIDGSVLTLLGTGTYATSGARYAGHREVITMVPEPQNGMKQGTVWLEAASIIKDPNEPELAEKFIKHVTGTDVAYLLSLTEITCNPTPNAEVEKRYTEDERDILQMDDVWTAWDMCHFHDIAPNIDEMLAIWQEELSRAG